MPRRKQDETVEKRTQQLLEEKAERRRLSAQVAAGTRRSATADRAQQQAETQEQAEPKRVAESALGGPLALPSRWDGQRHPRGTSRSLRDSGTTRADKAAKERKPRVYADLLTVAFRGPLANHFREMAQQHEMSLAKLLQDAMLVCEKSIAAGYKPGTTLEEWIAQQGDDTGNA